MSMKIAVPTCSYAYACTYVCACTLTFYESIFVTSFKKCASRAYESFTSRFVSLVALTGVAGFVFGSPCWHFFSRRTARQQALLGLHPRNIPDEALETSKIDLRRVQNRAPGKSKWSLGGLWGLWGGRSAPGGCQDRSETVSGQPWSALGSSWLWALLGAVLGRPGGSRELWGGSQGGSGRPF